MYDINYSFLVNLFDLTNYQAAFVVYGKYSIIGLLVILSVLLILIAINRKIKIKNRVVKLIIIILSTSYILSKYSLPRRFIKVRYNMHSNIDYKKTYKDLFREINNVDYVDRVNLITKIKDNSYKNLVFIIIESYEQKLIENNFKDISKDIISYSKSGEFFQNIDMIEGSGWTIAGIHTMMCGSPRIYDI